MGSDCGIGGQRAWAAILLWKPALTISNQIGIAATVATSAHALRTVSHLAHVVQDVLWQRAIADEFPGRQHAAAKIVALEREMEHKATV